MSRRTQSEYSTAMDYTRNAIVAGAALDAWMDGVDILREPTPQVGFGAPYFDQP